MHTLLILILGLVVGVLVGLLGIGGGIIVVPALVHLFGMDQHLAQGTSLFILLPPLGLGAAMVYWKKGLINLPAGLLCALGFLAGGYFGGLVAIDLPSNVLRAFFGLFLMFSALLLWRRSQPPVEPGKANG
ncbi:MAG TPA: sulfite exporter TauE/SafE family protein [Candidatus Acidoferrales bacterium]|nr:sulfite exporter TauE/SafE family protein [Candidatus Acidoferrales bacterium]